MKDKHSQSRLRQANKNKTKRTSAFCSLVMILGGCGCCCGCGCRSGCGCRL